VVNHGKQGFIHLKKSRKSGAKRRKRARTSLRATIARATRAEPAAADKTHSVWLLVLGKSRKRTFRVITKGQIVGL
jgi:hypothetical protein